MLTTILDEAVNGWILSIFDSNGKRQYIYERLTEAQEARRAIELRYEYGKLQEVVCPDAKSV